MKVLIVGDCHGFGGIVSAAHLAVDLGADAIIICGDVWDVDIEIYIAKDGVNAVPPIHVICGNHERWDVWAKGKFGEGIISHLDYTKFELGGLTFGVIGRIDDTPRIRELMALGLFLGDPNNIFFARLEGQKVRDALGGSDVLLFHDAPFPFVLGHRPITMAETYKGLGPADTEIMGSRYLNEVIRTVEPKLVFHGHMHLLDIRYIKQTRVYGLPPIDPEFAHRGYALLDTAVLHAQYFDMPGEKVV